MKPIFFSLAATLLAACASTAKPPTQENAFDGARLKGVLAAQDESAKARYSARHPYESLEFFQLAPGETVVELLPGEGWYSKILLPYLGKEGKLIGVDYPVSMWPNLPFGTAEFIEQRKNWPTQWAAEANQWNPDDAEVVAYTLETIPASLHGTVDTVLYIRALHNLARFESKGQFMTKALATTYALLKPGGVVAIEQHEAPESKDDTWADGSRGYLKRSFVKQVMAKAGFELVAESDINQNPHDQPGADDSVWRLPPSLATSKDNPKLAEEMKKIGESNRMTLLFRKPE